jgi:hypothetical protein
MNHSGDEQEIFEAILGAVKEPYLTIWFRSFVFDDGCINCALIQPKEMPKNYKNLSLSLIRERLKEMLLAMQRSNAQEPGREWTYITITLRADGEHSVDLGYEDPQKVDMHRLNTEWMKTAMHGLQFIPDKR